MNIKEIVAVRKANGLRQYDFAELIGVPIGTWSNVEAGRQPLYAEKEAIASKVLHDLNCDFSILEDPEAMDKLPKYVDGRRQTAPSHVEKPAVKVAESNVTFRREGANVPFTREEAMDLGVIPRIEELVSETVAIVQGVGKDEPIVTNELGGSQSQVQYRLDLIDPKALLATARVLKEGADKYGAENWRLIGINDHLNHLLIHAYAYLAGDRTDEHLSHAVCRALFALGVELQTERDIEKLNQSGE